MTANEKALSLFNQSKEAAAARRNEYLARVNELKEAKNRRENATTQAEYTLENETVEFLSAQLKKPAAAVPPPFTIDEYNETAEQVKTEFNSAMLALGAEAKTAFETLETLLLRMKETTNAAFTANNHLYSAIEPEARRAFGYNLVSPHALGVASSVYDAMGIIKNGMQPYWNKAE